MAERARFVGRDGELSRLLGALRGDARLILVVGDAGVGKTRFVAEGMARATAAGMVVVQGQCLPLAGTLPLLPVTDALGELAKLEDGRVLAAALDVAARYVRDEVERLLPGAGPDAEAAEDSHDKGWSQGRLFAAVAELLAAVAGRARPGVGVVVEDVHWADSATLDCLTFLARTGRRGRVRVVATCRSDESPVAAHVAGWLSDMRGAVGVEEIRLGPLSWEESADQMAALVASQVSARVAAELFVRAEGNPFFTEQLVAAALADTAGAGGLRIPVGLPARLAELLAARAARCAGDARVVLAGLAVAGRPLTEDLLDVVTGLDTEAVRRGLRELAATRLLADDTAGGGHRPRHTLLAEAVAGGLLPGERAVLHARTARALAGTGDPGLAAEVARHWQAAGRPAEELPARVAAAGAGEHVFGYAQAAAHWQRAIELCQAAPGAADAAGIELPRLYVRTIDALHLSGDNVRAGVVAEEAYRRFARHADPAIAAAVLHRAGYFRALDAPGAGLPAIEEALRLYRQAPPSFDHAEALLQAGSFLLSIQGRVEASVTALNQALEVAETAGATSLIPRILSIIASAAFMRGQIEEGIATYERAWTLARAAQDGPALVWLADNESDDLLRFARFQAAADVASRGLGAARQAGLQSWNVATILAGNAAEALLALGRTGQAARLIDPLTTARPDRDHWWVHVARAEIDVLRGDTRAAAQRRHLIYAIPGVIGRADFAHEVARRSAEAALWDGRPGDALDEVQRVLPLINTSDLAMFCGRLLVVGMWACADLAQQAQARRDQPTVVAAVAAADGLVCWVEGMGGVPFADHPYVAAIPAERATWDAERARLAGASNHGVWASAAKAWQGLGCPHRAGYAWWRQAQALLDAGQPPTAAGGPLRAAAAAADGHAPLLAQVGTLAERARISLHRPVAGQAAAPPARAGAPYGLTGRELAVLRLLAAGHTNAGIGAALYISPKTAGVHVSSILRKLGVSGRVQAAAVAERAGLLQAQQAGR